MRVEYCKNGLIGLRISKTIVVISQSLSLLCGVYLVLNDSTRKALFLTTTALTKMLQIIARQLRQTETLDSFSGKN